MTFLKNLEKCINYIIKDGDILNGDFNLREIDYNNYTINSLFLNNKRISTKKCRVNYKCHTCESEDTILLKRFLSKESFRCKKCRELEKTKRDKQSNFMKNTFKKFGRVLECGNENKRIKHIGYTKWSTDELIKKSLNNFKNEDIEFKEKYFERIMTKTEFKSISNKLVVDDSILTKDINYYPALITNNQHKYCPGILLNGEIVFISEYSKRIKLKCETCDKVFNGRYFKRRSNTKVLCKYCGLCNDSFKVRSIKNINGDKIKYQSKIEMDLINFCNNNNVLIENGPNIKYHFKEKIRNYMVDFKIGEYLIETKDNHIWHKNQVGSGKWDKKEECAIKYCSVNNMKYKLLFPKDIEGFKNIIT